MEKSGTGLVHLLLVFLAGQTTASIWRPIVPPTLPPNSDDPYYRAFKKVPSTQTTANKFVKNFLQLSRSTTKRQTSAEDVVIVLDGSGSIGSCEFEKGKIALSYLMDSAKESNPTVDTKYAAVTFADLATVNFKFLKYSSAARSVKMIPYPSGSTNTQAGLNEALNLFKNTGSGGRTFGRKVVLLITDGHSNVQRGLTIPKAEALKRNGVFIYVIAVGGEFMSGIDEMVKVVYWPSRAPQDYLFRVSDLSGLVDVIKLVVKQVAPGKYKIINGQPNKPCHNG